MRLWVEQTNAEGGLQRANGKALIDLIEHDDQTNPQQAIQAAQHLATLDQVDFAVAPYSTGLNLAAAPIFAQLGHPEITGTAVTNQQPELAAQFPNMFFILGRTGVMGMGGVNADDPAIQTFAEAHTAMAGQGPDFWASAATSATLEVLGQAIEAVRSADRAAVLAHLQDRASTSETILGPVNFNENNDNERYRTVGQWQNGVFRGVAALGRAWPRGCGGRPALRRLELI